MKHVAVLILCALALQGCATSKGGYASHSSGTLTYYGGGQDNGGHGRGGGVDPFDTGLKLSRSVTYEIVAVRLLDLLA